MGGSHMSAFRCAFQPALWQPQSILLFGWTLNPKQDGDHDEAATAPQQLLHSQSGIHKAGCSQVPAAVDTVAPV